MRRFMMVAAALLFSTPLAAQDQRDEQYYYPGRFNFQFLKRHPEGARLFNAFDYGHAILYEKLLTLPSSEREAALEREYQFLTTDLLVKPPRFAVAEEAIEPTYAKTAWQAKQMFDWAHILHRQIYDVYADDRLSMAAKDSLIERITDYYLTRTDYAFTVVPKSMALMDEQSFSQVFRRRYEKFNGLIWAYHWLQVGLYEPFLAHSTPAEQKAGVRLTVSRFWDMLEDAPTKMPSIMPMTATVAPRFAAAHPRAAIIFDNLHMMHDIISDILESSDIPADQKRRVIYEQLAEFRNPTTNLMTMDEWRTMGDMMGGIGLMGGPAVGPPLPPGPRAPAAGHEGHKPVPTPHNHP